MAAFIAPVLGGFVLEHLGATFLWRSCLVVGLIVAASYFVLGRVHAARVRAILPEGHVNEDKFTTV